VVEAAGHYCARELNFTQFANKNIEHTVLVAVAGATRQYLTEDWHVSGAVNSCNERVSLWAGTSKFDPIVTCLVWNLLALEDSPEWLDHVTVGFDSPCGK